jgi:tape measure domain-containing protein
MSDIALKVTSDSSQAQRDLERLSASVGRIEKTTTSATKTLASLAGTVTAAFAAFGAVNAITRASDSFTNLENRIALVVGRTKELIVVQSELLALSVKTRGSLQGTVEVFTKFGSALKGTNTSTKQLLQATENVQKAVTISGTAGESARAALIQLGQGLSSGQLRGEELNSVLEQTPRIARAIADGIGSSIGELRKLAEEGRLTTDVVFKALLSQTEKLNSEFAMLAPTFEQSTVRLKDSINLLLSEISKSSGLSQLLGSNINRVSIIITNLAEVADVYFTILSSRFSETIRDAKLVASAFANLIVAVGKNISAIVPVIRTFTAPLTVLANSFFFDRLRISFLAFYESVFGARKEVLGLVEALGLFTLFGDTRTSRTIGDIFDSKSVIELTRNINKLAEGLDPNNVFGFLAFSVGFRDNFVTPLYRGVASLKSFGAAIGIASNPLIEFSNIRFDRFIELGRQSLQILSYTVQRFFVPAVLLALTYIAEFATNLVYLTRSLLGINPSLLETFSIIQVRGVTGLKLLVSNLLGLDVAAGALYGFSTAFAELRFVIIETALAVVAYMLYMSERIEDSIFTRLSKVDDFIRKFAENIKAYFFDIYDKVVGRSYWPDLVDGVLLWADKLYVEGTAKIELFAKRVKASFNNIANSTRELFSKVTAKGIDTKEVIAKSSIGSSIKERVKDTVANIKLKIEKIDVKDIVASLPLRELGLVFKNIADVAVLAAVLALVAPATFATFFSAAGTLVKLALVPRIAEALYEAFDANVFKEVGETAGSIIGFYLREALLSIPKLLGELVTFADAFGKAFLDQFGIIGQAISSFFSLLSVGDSGILGTILVGGGIATILSKVAVVKEFVTGFLTFITGLSGGSKDKGGLVGQALLGANFKYLVAGIALIFSGFSEQVNLAVALAGGIPLITLAILGEDVAGKLVKDAITSVFRFFITQSLAAAATLSKTKLFTNLFGEVKAGEIAGKINKVKDLVGKVLGNINSGENRENYTKGKISITDFLFGKEDGDAVRKSVAEKVSGVADKVKDNITKATDKFKDLGKNKSFLDTSMLGKEGVDPAERAKVYTENIKKVLDKMNVDVEGMAGSEGLLGKLFKGKKGLVVGALLSAFALFTSAANAAQAETASASSSIVNSVLSFVGEYGIYALLLPPAGWAFFGGALKNVVSAFGILGGAGLTALKAVGTGLNGLGIGMGLLASTLQLLTGGWVNFFVKFAAGLKVLINGILFLGGILGAVFGGILAAVAFVIKGIILVATSVAGIVAIVASLSIGAIAVWLFGEGNSFTTKLDDVIEKISKLFRLKPSGQKQLEALLPRSELGGQALDFSGKISGINYSKLTEGQSKSLQSLGTRLSEVIKRAKEEEEELGSVTTETTADLQKLRDLFDKKAEKYAFNSSIDDLGAAMKGAQTQAESLYVFLNKDLERKVPFFSGFSVENFVLPFEQFLDKYTLFNDARSRTLNSEVGSNVEIFKEIDKYLKPEEIQMSVTAFNRLNSAIDDLNGFSGIFTRLFGGFPRAELELELARKQVNKLTSEFKKLAEERAAVDKYQTSLTEAQKALSNLEKFQPGAGIKVELKDLFGFNDPAQVVELVKELEDLFKQLKEKAKGSEEALAIQVQIDAKLENVKFTVEESKIAGSLKLRLEDLFKRAGTNINVEQLFKFASLSSIKGFGDRLFALKNKMDEARRNISLAGNDVNKLAEAFKASRDATRDFNAEIAKLAGNEGLSGALSSLGVNLSRELIDSFGSRGVKRLEGFKKRLEELDAISIDPEASASAKQNAARQAIQLKKVIQDEFQNRDFFENFAFQIGKTNLSVDLMKSLMLSPTESKRVIELLAQSFKDKSLLKNLARDASGLPANPNQAKEISDRIVGTDAEYAKIMRDKGKNVLELFAESLSKGDSKIDIGALFKSGFDVKDILSAQELSKQIKEIDDKKNEYLLTRTNDPAGLKTLDVEVITAFDKQIEALSKKRNAVLDRNLITKIESLASRTGVTVGQEFFQGFKEGDLNQFEDIRIKLNELDEARKKLVITEGDTFKILDEKALRENFKAVEALRNRADILVNGELPNIIKKSKYDFKIIDIARFGKDSRTVKQLLIDLGTEEKRLADLEKGVDPLSEESLKRINEARASIKAITNSLDKFKARPETFGDLASQISANTGLPTDLLRKLDPKEFGLAQAASAKIAELNKDINDLKLEGNSLDLDKLALLEKQLTLVQKIGQGISTQDDRRKQISSSLLGASKDLIKNTITGEKDIGKTFLNSITSTVTDAFAGQLNDFLFKDITNGLGKMLGTSMFGELGSSEAKPMYVKITQGLEGLIGDKNGLLGGFADKLKGFGSGIGDFFSKGFSGFSSLFSFLPGFAAGGVIPGNMGSATPVLAHAGEVILNEAQQARVASAMSNQNQQVVNVNITGDISRQTKSEIYRMLPSIAEGVNSHNREKGLR